MGRICGDVLLVPKDLSGHINPMMYFVKGFMKKGLTVTMILCEDRTDLMKSHMGGEDMEGFHLELVQSTKGMRSEGFPPLANIENFGIACEPYLKRILAEQQAGGEGPRCMIADQFMGWSQSWADKLQIPRYVSIVSPATFGFVMYNYSSLYPKLLHNIRPEDNPPVELPGIGNIHLNDCTTSARLSPKFLYGSGDTFDASAGILFNTFYDLEAGVLDAFEAQVKSKGGKGVKLLPIGPMLPPEFFSEGTFQGTETDDECIQWLDARPAHSVLYVAFGSGGSLSPPQVQELAKGLEASQVPFLWVLRLSSAGTGGDSLETLLPRGFLERTKDRGLVYPLFAPQLQILSHPATGGFLTHCGWNSSLESICRGVPMIGWPLAAEQLLCCRVLVDQAKVATDVRPLLAQSPELVKGEEVEQAVKYLMTQPEGQELRKRVVELQSRARAAMGPGGSTTENINALVRDIQSVDPRKSQ